MDCRAPLLPGGTAVCHVPTTHRLDQRRRGETPCLRLPAARTPASPGPVATTPERPHVSTGGNVPARGRIEGYWANLIRHIFRAISPLASPSAAARRATVLGRRRRSTCRECALRRWLPRASSGSQLDPVPRRNSDSLCVERRWRPSNAPWRGKLAQHLETVTRPRGATEAQLP